MAQANQTNWDKALEIAKIGGLVYVGWKVIKLVENLEDSVTDNKLDKGTSQETACKSFDYKKLSWKQGIYDAACDQIQSAIWERLFSATENDKAFAEGLLICWNDDDVQKLICTYGQRGKRDAWSPIYNLVTSIELFLDQDQKERVNTEYHNRGIQIYWL